MIYGFVRQSRGHLQIKSQPGQGATVALFLPRALEDAIKPEAHSATARRGRGEIILVVEDDPTVRSIISDVLDELHYTDLKAADARAAIPLLQSDQKIDLLVSDVVLPHVNGRKLAEVARSVRPGLKVLFVTGYAEDAQLRADFLDSGMDMLMKPFDLEELGARVRLLIEQ